MTFIYDCAVESANERHRIMLGRGQRRLIVEGHVAAALLSEAACESGFTRLTRAADRDDPRVTKRRADKTL
jgi:hypothetical protein